MPMKTIPTALMVQHVGLVELHAQKLKVLLSATDANERGVPTEEVRTEIGAIKRWITQVDNAFANTMQVPSA